MEKIYQYYLKCNGISIDSRKIEPGNMFFALKGPNFNANQFALQAIEKGAIYAVVDDAKIAKKHPQLIQTDDVLITLQKLANYHRIHFKGVVFALTGSNGKTTTKELIASVMSQQFKTHYTPGNYNNLIGLPFTILNMPEQTEFLILEMGANGPGEIEKLCAIAKPDSGLITNIGKAHLEGFGSIEGVKKAKSELYNSLKSDDGTTFVNLDEKFLDELSSPITKKIFYGSRSDGKVSKLNLKACLLAHYPTLKISFTWENNTTQYVDSNLPGSYNYANIITAIAVGKFYGLSDALVIKGIQSYTPKNNRSQWEQIGTNRFFMDAYNANPSSMRASLFSFLENCSELPILILGDMREVGDYSLYEHQILIDELYQKSKKIKELWLVGEEFQKINIKGKTKRFLNSDEAKKYFKHQNYSGEVFFMKGSRGIALEKIIPKH